MNYVFFVAARNKTPTTGDRTLQQELKDLLLELTLMGQPLPSRYR